MSEELSVEGGTVREASVPANLLNNVNAPWTDDDIATLQKLWVEGQSASQIGAVLKRSRCSVLGKLSRYRNKVVRKKAAADLDEANRRNRALRRSSLGPVRRSRHPHSEVLAKAAAKTNGAEPALKQTTPQEIPEPVPETHCTLFELTENACRWPLGTPGEADFCFCGGKALEGLPYCGFHSRRAFAAKYHD